MNNTNDIIIQVYINLLKSGKMKLEDIPDRYREKVQDKLNETAVG